MTVSTIVTNDIVDVHTKTFTDKKAWGGSEESGKQNLDPTVMSDPNSTFWVALPEVA